MYTGAKVRARTRVHGLRTHQRENVERPSRTRVSVGLNLPRALPSIFGLTRFPRVSRERVRLLF